MEARNKQVISALKKYEEFDNNMMMLRNVPGDSGFSYKPERTKNMTWRRENLINSAKIIKERLEAQLLGNHILPRFRLVDNTVLSPDDDDDSQSES